MVLGQILGPFASTNYFKPRGLCPIDQLSDERRLISVGHRIDNTGLQRLPGQKRPRKYIGLDNLKFPDIPDIAQGKTYAQRVYPPSKVELEPGYVVHKRLYFEEKNAERYGWELGAAQPFVSAAYFYKDFAFLPYHFASNLCERYDTSAGKCLPGSPVPYYIYPPGCSWTGLLAEAGVVTGLTFIFP